MTSASFALAKEAGLVPASSSASTLSYSIKAAPASATASANLQPRSRSFSHSYALSFPQGSPPNKVSNGLSSTENSLHAHRQNHNSSKLPAFRFADLKKESFILPALLQHIPGLQSPVSPPNPNPNQTTNPLPNSNFASTHETIDSTSQSNQDKQDSQINRITQQDTCTQPGPQRQNQQNPVSSSPPPPPAHQQVQKPVPAESPPTASSTSRPRLSRHRASTFQTSSVSDPIAPAAATKRPASFPDSPKSAQAQPSVSNANSPPSVATTTIANNSHRPQRRAPASFGANGIETTPDPPSALTTKRSHTVEVNQGGAQPADDSTKEWAQGQRELLLPKSVQATATDERRKSRPPVSFRPPLNTVSATPGGRAVIPPIRSFRSSGSRKSLILDMNTIPLRSYDDGDDVSDANQRDRTLRALEGRADSDLLQMTPPDSAEATPENENTADLFLRMAREEPARRALEEHAAAPEDQTAVSRIARSTHRRPFSAAIPSYQAMSPPQISRRLSDQRDSIRTRRFADEQQSAQQITRELAYRTNTKERPLPSTLNTDDTIRARTSAALRPSPITPRNLAFQDTPADSISSYSRRRTSITESNSGLPSRTPSYKQSNLSYGHPKAYSSSPLVPRAVDAHRPDMHHGAEMGHGIEGTESTASTAAPSTVWDELDDLKLRIRRMEETGKVPKTPGPAMSRVSDERPPTATTTGTTISTSPKRLVVKNTTPVEGSSTASLHRETSTILTSALSKSKPLLSPEAYSAIESAATDALALSSMMGAPGQPGPISSGASTIGAVASVTDRQLRKKVDGICRSLTELCIALNEEVNRSRPGQTATTPREKEPVRSPTVTKNFAGLPAQRRPVATSEQAAGRINGSPRTMTSLGDRRTTLLGTTTASPRYAGVPGTPSEVGPAGRKSSLLIARTRRAGTEEPPEESGRKSSLLRTRRAGTEEPDEGRKTSLLLHGRRGANGEDDDEVRFRAPSRAATEVSALRSGPRAPTSQGPLDSSSLGNSALPRRRLVSSVNNSRLVAPSTPSSLANRRFIDRATPDRDGNSVADKLAEDRGQRQLSLSQTALLRTSSINRRNRENGIPNGTSSTPLASQTAGYK